MEKFFRFNPFTISKESDEQVIRSYAELEQSLYFDESPTAIAHDIDVYANMTYLIGEMIARYYMSVTQTEARLNSTIANQIYKERDQWIRTNAEKPPAMSYFENKASSMYLEEKCSLIEQESLLKRYKFAYESLGDKQNALKKKLEAVKFDVMNV